LTDGSHRIDRLENIARKHGRKGLETLLLFKVINSCLETEIQRQYRGHDLEYDKEKLNELCIRKARDLVMQGKEEPTEDDIKSLLKQLVTRTG